MDMRYEGKKKEGMWCWTDLGMVAPCQVRVELKACEELTALVAKKEEGRKRREGFFDSLGPGRQRAKSWTVLDQAAFANRPRLNAIVPCEYLAAGLGKPTKLAVGKPMVATSAGEQNQEVVWVHTNTWSTSASSVRLRLWPSLVCVLRCMPCWPTSPQYMTLLFQNELRTSGYMKPVTGKHETHQPTLDTFEKHCKHNS